jgi:adenylate kinase
VKSISTTLKKIESIFKGSKVEDNVDWLHLVLKKGDLQKFFPY